MCITSGTESFLKDSCVLPCNFTGSVVDSCVTNWSVKHTAHENLFREWEANVIQIRDQRTEHLKGNFVHFDSHKVSNSCWLLLIHQGYKRANIKLYPLTKLNMR